jgi:hypothetical protein
MNTHSQIKVKFPLGQFLKQLLFSPLSEAVFNPIYFWYLYRVQLLERCWEQDCDFVNYMRFWYSYLIQLLERCWEQDYIQLLERCLVQDLKNL